MCGLVEHGGGDCAVALFDAKCRACDQRTEGYNTSQRVDAVVLVVVDPAVFVC